MLFREDFLFPENSLAISSSGCGKLAAECCFAPWGAATCGGKIVSRLSL
jgi:hypothetical protein